jgi:arylsulfatase
MNILLIIADQWRGDCLGIDGHPDVKTPVLDRLAATGTRFANAYTACPSCIPARAALYTGMSQERHGRVGYADGVTWNYPHTLAGELTKAGYQTQCCGKLHVHPPRNRVGYEAVDLHDGYLHYYRTATCRYCDNQHTSDDYLWALRSELGAAADVTDTGIDCNSWLARPWPYDERLHPTTWATDRAIDFLRRREREKPFFLTVSYVRPHPPFDAPAQYFDMYDPDKLTLPEYGDWEDRSRLDRGGRITDSDTGPADPALLARARQGYYACISQIDFQIGRLLEALYADSGGDTLILFTSDHGEMLGDHCFFRKSLPYEGSARIPLIISGSYKGKPAPSVRCDVAELRDVMPTLLGAAGVAVPDTCDGLNLLSPHAGREYIHGEHLNGQLGNHFIVTNRDKYIWFSQTGREQYFDLDADPYERRDAINDPCCTERAAYLRAALIKELSFREEGFVADGALVPGRPVKAVLEHPSR